MYAKKHVSKIAEKKKIPDDWCYIYNFDNPNEPIAISMPAGSRKNIQRQYGQLHY